jgi:hypoxanthine phosphoribosyltransferase
MIKVRVLGPVRIEYEPAGAGGDLQPLETCLVTALSLTTDDDRGSRPGGTLRLGGLTDPELAKAVWNNASLSRNVQRAINHINATTPIRIEKEDRRRYIARSVSEVDYNAFATLQTKANESIDLRTKFETMDRALDLVRGTPLDGLGKLTDLLQRKRDEISAEICDTTVLWLEAAILLNEKWAVLDKACQIHQWFPDNEMICRYLMYLLYRSGRRSRALECRDTTVRAVNGLPQCMKELSDIIQEHGDVVRATESLNLRIPSSGEPFSHRFSFAEIGEFLERMVGRGGAERQLISTTQNSAQPIKEWRPDLIVGINRGGSIVGGMLAMHFGMTRVIPITIPWKTDDDGHREYYTAVPPAYVADHPEDDPATVQRILLADDAFRTGNHVKFARRELQAVFPAAEIRVAALISVRQDVSYGEGPGRGGVGGPTYYGQLVSSRNFTLPWSPSNSGGSS